MSKMKKKTGTGALIIPASLHGWAPRTGEKYSWQKGDHIIRVRPTNSNAPRGSKTVWLIENRRIGYVKRYSEGEKLASTFMRKW